LPIYRLKIVQLYKILSKYEYSAVRRSDLETFEKIMAKRNKEKIIRKVTRLLPGHRRYLRGLCSAYKV
jgi:hypothetical protein